METLKMNKVEKCSFTQIGRIVIHKDDKEKRVYKEELNSYLSDGWEIGISDKHRNTQSEVHIGNEPGNKGKPMSKETYEKVKSSGTWFGNRPSWNKGKGGYTIPKDKLERKLEKEFETKRKNNSFNTSKPELEMLEQLKQENPGKTIIHPYKDKKRYPFYCDFYIVEDDLFIELHKHWTHGGRPYNPDDDWCKKQLADWTKKAEQSEYYKVAIVTWTDRDVRKLQCAKKNNLNYKVIY